MAVWDRGPSAHIAGWLTSWVLSHGGDYVNSNSPTGLQNRLPYLQTQVCFHSQPQLEPRPLEHRGGCCHHLWPQTQLSLEDEEPPGGVPSLLIWSTSFPWLHMELLSSPILLSLTVYTQSHQRASFCLTQCRTNLRVPGLFRVITQVFLAMNCRVLTNLYPLRESSKLLLCLLYKLKNMFLQF